MRTEKTVMEQNGKSGCDGKEQLFQLTEDCVLDLRRGQTSEQGYLYYAYYYDD